MKPAAVFRGVTPKIKDAPLFAVRLMNLSSANLLPYQPFREPTIMPLVKYFRMKG